MTIKEKAWDNLKARIVELREFPGNKSAIEKLEMYVDQAWEEAKK